MLKFLRYSSEMSASNPIQLIQLELNQLIYINKVKRNGNCLFLRLQIFGHLRAKTGIAVSPNSKMINV